MHRSTSVHFGPLRKLWDSTPALIFLNKLKVNKSAALAVILVCTLGGCSSARMGDTESDNLFRSQRYSEAAERLKKGLEKETEGGRDGLLFMLDYALALHAAGEYELSNRAFLRADKLAEIKDYTSLATEAATVLITDQIKQYKAEDFEYVLISVYLAMNFACEAKYDDALVEARRVNRKLHMMVTEGKRSYKQNTFARYLSAVLYESQGEWNDAYIDYKETAKLLPTFKRVGEDLFAMANKLRMRDEAEKWASQYDVSESRQKEILQNQKDKKRGEIVILYQNGISPEKKEHPSFYTIPKFYPRLNPVAFAKVKVIREGTLIMQNTETQLLHDIESTAIQNLDEKYAGLIAKKVAGVVAKEVIGHQVAKKTDSPLLGAITKLALYAADRADLRSWNLLPKDLQIARVSVEPGVYTVNVEPNGKPALQPKTITVEPGKKVFIGFRYMP